jgi:ribosomal protein S18 acetylase RimI-like enzyme
MLDNPFWASLTTPHAAFAIGDGSVRRYPADVAPFLAVAEAGMPLPQSLVATGEAVIVVGPRPVGGTIEDHGVILQMVCDATPEVPDGPPLVQLGEEHRADVLALTALVYPHYFRPRTMELGRFFGIYDGPHLAAITGERMGFPGFRELSTVCTHPDYVGRGLARRVLAHITADLHTRGVTPFLHVSPDNTRAIRLYEQIGFRVRREIGLATLRR